MATRAIPGLEAGTIKNLDFVGLAFVFFPTEQEMLDALGDKEETFAHGHTIRRCRHCKTPVAGGPTACNRCVKLQDIGMTQKQKRANKNKFGRESAFFDGFIDEISVWDRPMWHTNFTPPTEKLEDKHG